ncbi:type I restriction and modification enzyme subunit R-like protein [Breznakibacter xylanolyticus]|uniref:Type I restriction and modification enzyme subunit R-like protein n=1 Tax=Breznakibacter xylanolyticus TaxID=990 RepID=A0A2W7PBJ9_9BACT|nr:type I restriction enzyme HsdR N-terminal domain-containing protein [Breznakibacter xylanolyticus]PZX20702.1 type I restriction and modification enzyme subunit R-like protein [Breznakibacter xylanolyticus]
MEKLNLPPYSFRLRKDGLKRMIFDVFRKKWVTLTPEEWVRQNFVRFLVEHRQYPCALIGIEVMVIVNGLKQRADVIVYDRQGQPVMIVECKATSVPLTNQVFDQAARYNLIHKVPFLMVTNGIQHLGARLHHEACCYDWLSDVPDYEQLCRR